MYTYLFFDDQKLFGRGGSCRRPLASALRL